MIRLFSSWGWLGPVLALAAGLPLLIGAEVVYFRARQAERAAEEADRFVAARAEAAAGCLSRDEWESALRLLHEALAVDRARNRAVLSPLLLRAQKGQATALLKGARGALEGKDVSAALELLRTYRAHPQAPDPEAAARLQRDVEQATNEAAAVQLLSRWSDVSLARFAQTGRLDAKDWQGDEAAGEVFKATLRRHLGAEQRRRQEQQAAQHREEERQAAERAARKARVCGSGPYRDLLAFTASCRKRLAEERELARLRHGAMENLLRQTRAEDGDDGERIRSGLLTDGEDARKDFAEAVARKRAEIKQAFRRADSDPAAVAVFDCLADQELDALLKERGDF